jgi:SAM-dependent methyltransferase
VSDTAALARFYEEAYSRGPGDGERYARWRALGAIGKADHVLALCRRAGLEPTSTLEVGCGDGALLGELQGRGFGGSLAGVEIAEAAVAIAARRPGIDVQLYDGARLPYRERTFELGILSHVLEHVPAPATLLAETARVCGAVIVEVPLEDNLSARRASRRATAEAVGHLQRFDRDAARALAPAAGLRVAAELDDPLPRAVHRFFATTPRARAASSVKWGLRAGLHALAPPLARRLFTLHFACLCLPRGG